MEDFNTDDKGGSSGLHVALERSSSEKPYLGDPAVLGDLVRALIGAATVRFSQVLAGTMTPEQAGAGDSADGLALADTLSGKNAEYEPVGAWNPTGLARAIRDTLPAHATPEAAADDVETVRLAIGVLLMETYDVLGEMEQIGAEAARDALDGVAGDFTNLFAGLPVNGDAHLPGDEDPLQ